MKAVYLISEYSQLKAEAGTFHCFPDFCETGILPHQSLYKRPAEAAAGRLQSTYLLQPFWIQCNTVKGAQLCAPTINLYFIDLKNVITLENF